MSHKKPKQRKTNSHKEESPVAHPEDERHRPEAAENDTGARANPSDQNEQDSKASALNRAEWWVVALTALILVTNFLQWQATKTAIGLNREVFMTSSRAYISVKEARIKRTTRTDVGLVTPVETKQWKVDVGFPLLEVIFINSGTTPALDVRTKHHIELSLARITSDRTENPDSGGGVSTVAKDTVFTVGGALPRELTKTEVGEIRNDRLFLSIWGSIFYRDGFGKNHSTRYCFVYSAEADGMNPCSANNDLN